MTVTLRDGSQVGDPRLDRVVRFDERSRQHPARALLASGAPRALRSRHWAVAATLDQGQEGRCVEFSLCHEMLSAPTRVASRYIDAILKDRLIYWPAQRSDPFPGGSYPGADPLSEGTSVLDGIKAAVALGLYKGYRWCFGLEDVLLVLGYVGPVVLGVNWHRHMARPDERGFISATGPVDGGHAILARGVRIVWLPGSPRAGLADIDLDRSYITLRNSWGPDWGRDGDCYLTLRDLDVLLRAQGEAVVPVGRRSKPPKGYALAA